MKASYTPIEALGETMALAAQTRQAKYLTEVKDKFPPIEWIEERVNYGILSWTLLDSCQRWIRRMAVMDIGNGPQTASEIARDYLDAAYPKRLRATGPQADVLARRRVVPIYCTPMHIRTGVYVDLFSAFWSIMALIGWNVDYYPGRWLIPGRPPLDFPAVHHKIARNCLVSAGGNGPLRIWTGKAFTVRYPKNNHLNLGLWAAICDILHAVAWEARELGAIYINNDGYIIDASKADELMSRISDYGLQGRVKYYGETWVSGMGIWRVGDKLTKVQKWDRLSRNIDHLDKTVDGERLREKLQMIVRLRKRQGLILRHDNG